MLKTATKQTIAFLLLLLAAMPLVYILFARVQQQAIRKSMKVRLETEVLETLAVHVNDIIWVKQGKEILVNSRMFDIKTTHLQNGVYVFTGLYDQKETVLLNNLKKNQQKGTAENKLFVQLFQFMLTCYHNQQADFIFCENMGSENIFTNIPSLHSGYLSIFSPPPQA